jgi:hypothetical protein
MTRRSLTESFNAHVALSKTTDNSPLARALKKYGRESFKIEVLDTVDPEKEDPNAVKAFWIDRLGTMTPRGYNAYSKLHGTPVFTNKVSDEDI